MRRTGGEARHERVRTAARLFATDSNDATDLSQLRRRSIRKLRIEQSKNLWRTRKGDRDSSSEEAEGSEFGSTLSATDSHRSNASMLGGG
eukprot:COSAG05_NODE_5544_length_1146_cov_0.898758_1_plen_89_part_10